jgi:hypothetical protein
MIYIFSNEKQEGVLDTFLNDCKGKLGAVKLVWSDEKVTIEFEDKNNPDKPIKRIVTKRTVNFVRG